MDASSTSSQRLHGHPTRNNAHEAIVRLCREDAARAPAARAAAQRKAGVDEPSDSLKATTKRAFKRLLGVACLLATGNASESPSIATTAAMNILVYLQVCVCCAWHFCAGSKEQFKLVATPWVDS
jgi:hypothetical protein